MKGREPRPSAWPVTLATGVSLAALGLATSWVISVGGAILALIALVGWVLDMTAEEEQEEAGT